MNGDQNGIAVCSRHKGMHERSLSVRRGVMGVVLTLRQADWGGRMVPPPTVPTSTEGMVQVM